MSDRSVHFFNSSQWCPALLQKGVLGTLLVLIYFVRVRGKLSFLSQNLNFHCSSTTINKLEDSNFIPVQKEEKRRKKRKRTDDSELGEM